MLTYSKGKWTEGFDHVIMGHYHLNRLEQQQGHSFLCTGDWFNHFSYGLFSEGELSLQVWPEGQQQTPASKPAGKEHHAPAH